MNTPRLLPVSDDEMAAVQGGGLFSWLGKVVGAVDRIVRMVGKPWT